MYLARVQLDPTKTKRLTNLQQYHGWIEDCFPIDRQNPTRPRHLWRIDQLYNQPYLLVVSPTAPDLHVLSRYGVPGTAAVKPYQPFLDRLQAGQHCKFQLTANPVYVANQTKRRVPYLTEADQLVWLLSRADQLGVQFTPNVHILGTTTQPVIKDRQRWSLLKVTYAGELIVKDPDQLRHTLINGIGRDRAYGTGLLTVLPLA